MSSPMELELQMFMNCQVDAGHRIWSSAKAARALDCSASISPTPIVQDLKKQNKTKPEPDKSSEQAVNRLSH